MLTRRARGTLKKSADNNFLNMTEELIHKEVHDFAINLYGIFSVITDKYSSDAILELIPQTILILNRLDAVFQENEDINKFLKETMQENAFLRRSIESEKQNSKSNLDASLSYEVETNKEIASLRQLLVDMEVNYNKTMEELQAKDSIINTLRADCEEISRNLHATNENHVLSSTQIEQPFVRPKKSHRVPTTQPVAGHTLETHNTFLPLTIDDSDCQPGHTLQVEALVHRTGDGTPTGTGGTGKHISTYNTGVLKRKIAVLSDSHGKGLFHNIAGNIEDTEMFVLTKPGAKLKHILKEGLPLVEGFSKKDYVVVLGGTNDLGVGEPSQLTLHQGMKSLLSWNVDTNIVIVDVPYRYDCPELNDNIYFHNNNIKKYIKKHEGKSNLIHLRINESLRRTHYTNHGLHLKHRGKKVLGKLLLNLIHNRTTIESDIIDGYPLQHKKITAARPIRSTNVTQNRCCTREGSPDIVHVSSSPILPSIATVSHRPGGLLSLGSRYEDDSLILSSDDFPPLPSHHLGNDHRHATTLQSDDECFLESVGGILEIV